MHFHSFLVNDTIKYDWIQELFEMSRFVGFLRLKGLFLLHVSLLVVLRLMSTTFYQSTYPYWSEIHLPVSSQYLHTQSRVEHLL